MTTQHLGKSLTRQATTPDSELNGLGIQSPALLRLAQNLTALQRDFQHQKCLASIIVGCAQEPVEKISATTTTPWVQSTRQVQCVLLC